MPAFAARAGALVGRDASAAVEVWWGAMSKRLRRHAPQNPIEFTFDDVPMMGEAGDSLAVALWAAGERSLTRSPKYHRPRGPFCFTGECEGCLLRVQDTPNTMACQVRLQPGMRVSSQNYLGAPKLDLLRATDFMFPRGLDHHEFMAGVPIAEDLMKAMARRIAGLGTLPSAPPPSATRASREQVDVLVVGAGLAGRAFAAAQRAVVIDASGAAGARAGIAIGVYGAPEGPREVLVLEPERTVLYQPRALVLAPGTHEGLPPFEDNDLPGILSLRGADALRAREVEPGHAPLVLEIPGGTGLGRAFAAAHGYRHLVGAPLAARGGSAIERVRVKSDDGIQEHDTDALVLDGPRAPAFELAAQAGAHTVAGLCGFYVQTDGDGVAAADLWVIGEASGLAFEVGTAPAVTRAAIERQAVRAAASVRRALG